MSEAVMAAAETIESTPGTSRYQIETPANCLGYGKMINIKDQSKRTGDVGVKKGHMKNDDSKTGNMKPLTTHGI